MTAENIKLLRTVHGFADGMRIGLGQFLFFFFFYSPLLWQISLHTLDIRLLVGFACWVRCVWLDDAFYTRFAGSERVRRPTVDPTARAVVFVCLVLINASMNGCVDEYKANNNDDYEKRRNHNYFFS
jgi:hypothetical protein